MELINKVAQSSIQSFDLEEYFPAKEILPFDLKDYLFKGLILREKDFREALSIMDWQTYAGKNVAVFCSTDAIIPNWAYMLVAVNVQPYANAVYFGEPDDVIKRIYSETLAKIDVEQFRDKRVVIKGCSDKPIPVDAYLEISKLLRPVAKSIMYGEPCSTVPIFKRKD